MADSVQTPERVVIVLASDISPDTAVNVGACLAAGLSAASPTWAAISECVWARHCSVAW